MLSGLIFNLQKYSVHDGPGIRTTLFLKGCPLCCSWCHNPEGISPRKEILVLENRCTVCGECRQACPFAESMGGTGVLPTRNEPCTQCGSCVDACPSNARQMAGRELTVAEAMAEILKDRIFYDDSGGGVTFSGGEPLMQPGFLKAALQACRAHDIHTVVDTCGFACDRHYEEIAPLTHLFLFDLKLMDTARHERHCGVPNAVILENLKKLGRLHRNLWIRVPVIPGVNDDLENLTAIARFITGIESVRQVNLLPYHKTGAPKFQRLGKEYNLNSVEQPTPQHMAIAAQPFKDASLTVKIGG